MSGVDPDLDLSAVLIVAVVVAAVLVVVVVGGVVSAAGLWAGQMRWAGRKQRLMLLVLLRALLPLALLLLELSQLLVLLVDRSLSVLNVPLLLLIFWVLLLIFWVLLLLLSVSVGKRVWWLVPGRWGLWGLCWKKHHACSPVVCVWCGSKAVLELAPEVALQGNSGEGNFGRLLKAHVLPVANGHQLAIGDWALHQRCCCCCCCWLHHCVGALLGVLLLLLGAGH